jgi:hypothetical protein
VSEKNMIPEGVYMANVELVDAPPEWVGKTPDNKLSCVLGHAGTGNKQIEIHFRIAEGDYTGRTRTWFGFFSEKALERTLDSLVNIGFEGNNLNEFPLQRPTGLVPIVIKHEKDREGEMRDRIAFINRPGGGGVLTGNVMNPQDSLTFAAQMRARLEKKARPVSKPNGAVSKTVDPEI